MKRTKFNWRFPRVSFRAIKPEELIGKTPEQIAELYEGLIVTQKNTYEAALSAFETTPPNTPPNTPPKPPKVTFSEMMTDPEKHVKDMIKSNGVSREEWNTATAQMRDSMIYVAKKRALEEIEVEVAKTKGTSMWTRLAEQIDKVINAFDPMARTSPETWKSVYYYVVGQNQNTLTSEAVTAATAPVSEPGSPGGNEPPQPLKLSAEQIVVADGLGLTQDSFRKGIENMKGTKLPLTFDNRVKK